MVEPPVVLTGRFEQRVGADDVRVEERARVVQRVVVVRFGGVVHDGIRVGEELVNEGRVGDVALDEGDARVGQPVEGCQVAGVRELVEHCHVVVGVLDHVMHEVRADETGASGDKQM